MIFIIIFLAEDAKVAHMQDLSWQPDSGCSWVAITLHIPGRRSQKLKIVQKKGRVNRMSEIKLKSCPFCETEPYTSIVGSDDEKMKIYIQCNNPDCGTKMEFTIKAERVFLEFDDVIGGINKAIEAWNRRA